MPAQHRLSKQDRAAWRDRYAIGWQRYWDAHRDEFGLTSRDLVDADISAAAEKVLVDRGEDPRGCSAGLIKKFRTEGTAVPAKATVSSALAAVLDDPELHDLWSGRFAPATVTESPATVTANPAVVPAVPPAAAGDDPIDRPDATATGTNPSRRWLVAVGVALAVVVGAGAFVVTRSDGTSADTGRATGEPATTAVSEPAAASTAPAGTEPTATAALECASEPGAVGADLEQATGQPEWERSLKRAYATAGGEDAVGCTTGPAERVGDVVVQELSVDGGPGGVLLARTDEPQSAWWFSRSFWGNYHQVFIRAPYATGVPASPMVATDDGLIEVTTSLGGVFVAEREDAPFYLVSHLHADWWRSHPELGRPTSHPDPSLARQDFALGYGSLRVGELVNADAFVVADPAAELPAGPLAGHILRQSDTTTWWIPTEGVRQWIPDGDVWNCRGGDGVTIMKADGKPVDVPGYAIATLRFDGVATCDQP